MLISPHVLCVYKIITLTASYQLLKFHFIVQFFMKFFVFTSISFSFIAFKVFHVSIKICTAKHTFFTDNIHFSLFQLILSRSYIIMAPMKTLKNISFKNRLALSYSFILALMLISAAIFYHTSYHHLKKGLHSQTVSVLSSSVRQMMIF